MSRVICSFATGAAAAFAELTRPALVRYATIHGYELCIGLKPTLDPPSWGKVPLLSMLLDGYDAALWIDADCLIVDGSEDLATGVPETAAHAMVAHVVPEGRIPNCGVWYVTQAARPLLAETLDLYETYRDHVWWEQRAVIDRLNAGWKERTHWLDPGWNRHPCDRQHVRRVRIEHYTAMGDRLGALRRRVGA